MIGASWVAIGSIIAAVAPGRVHLSIDHCASADAREVKRLLRIELGKELVDAPQPGIPSASIRCDTARAILRYGSKTRAIELSKIDPRARPRLLALALAELAAPPKPPIKAPPASNTPASSKTPSNKRPPLATSPRNETPQPPPPSTPPESTPTSRRKTPSNPTAHPLIPPASTDSPPRKAPSNKTPPTPPLATSPPSETPQPPLEKTPSTPPESTPTSPRKTPSSRTPDSLIPPASTDSPPRKAPPVSSRTPDTPAIPPSRSYEPPAVEPPANPSRAAESPPITGDAPAHRPRAIEPPIAETPVQPRAHAGPALTSPLNAATRGESPADRRYLLDGVDSPARARVESPARRSDAGDRGAIDARARRSNAGGLRGADGVESPARRRVESPVRGAQNVANSRAPGGAPRRELDPKSERAREAEPPAAIVEATTTATSTLELHFAASVLGGLTLFTVAGPPAFGGRVAIEIAPSVFGARLDAGAYFGSERTDLGDVSLLIAGAGLSGFGRFTSSIAVFDVGAGGRAGFARIRGSPNDPSATEGATVSGAWAGPFLGGRATFLLGPISIAVEVEAGLVIRPVVGRAEGVLVAAADGAWFGFHLGLGLEP